jgi:hypothetical protein
MEAKGVQAMVCISVPANRVLNVIKAKYGLHNKSEAIDMMAKEYEEEILEPAFKPEFAKEILSASRNGKFRKFRDTKDLFK